MQNETQWVLVPREPTPEMAEAGEVTLSDVLKGVDYFMPTDGMFRVLRAALAAAPTPPAGGGAVALEGRSDRSAAWNAIFAALRDYRMSNMRDDLGGGYPLVDLMSNDGESIATGEEEMAMLADEISIALAAAPTPPAGGEAVAWLKEWTTDDGDECRRVDLTPDNEAWLAFLKPRVTPLYAAKEDKRD